MNVRVEPLTGILAGDILEVVEVGKNEITVTLLYRKPSPAPAPAESLPDLGLHVSDEMGVTEILR
jgi:hypothetical protein